MGVWKDHLHGLAEWWATCRGLGRHERSRLFIDRPFAQDDLTWRGDLHVSYLNTHSPVSQIVRNHWCPGLAPRYSRVSYSTWRILLPKYRWSSTKDSRWFRFVSNVPLSADFLKGFDVSPHSWRLIVTKETSTTQVEIIASYGNSIYVLDSKLVQDRVCSSSTIPRWIIP